MPTADRPYVLVSFGQSLLFGMQITTVDTYMGHIITLQDMGIYELVGLVWLFLGLNGIVVFNLMTAIIVEQTFDAMKSDLEMIQKHLEHKRIHQINVLFKMFQELDDDGSGIDKKDRENALRPFFRLETSRNKNTGAARRVL